MLSTRSFAFRLSALLWISLLSVAFHAHAISNNPGDGVPSGTQAVDITVGPMGAGCDYSDLQTAINQASDGDVIRLASGLDHTNKMYTIYLAGPSFTIRGGYSDCDASSTPSGRTTINVAASPTPVFDIWFSGDGPFRQINLENLVIKGSYGSQGAGLVVEGRAGQLQVRLRNVEVSNNHRTGGVSAHGGGVRMITTGDALSSDPLVSIDNASIIASNTAEGDGGGIYCHSNHDNGVNTLLRVGSTPIMNNKARNGGGIAVHGCRNVFLHSGERMILILPTGGIMLNEATGNGGGIYVSNGGEVFLGPGSAGGLGTPDHAALLIGNSADDSGGGALVIDSGSILHLEDTFIMNNTAGDSGGGLRVVEGGQVQVRRKAGTLACEPVESGSGTLIRPPCSVMENNSAGYGGGVSITGAGQVNISRTFIHNNQTDSGAEGEFARVANASNDSGPASTLRIHSSLITGHNGVLHFIGDSAEVDLRWSTIADNTGGAVAQLLSGQSKTAKVYTRGMVIDHDTDLFLLQGTGNNVASGFCVVTNQSTNGYTEKTAVSQIDPGLSNPGAGDFHLASNSPAIDVCTDSHSASLYPDLDGNTRGLEWTGPEPIRPPNRFSNGFFDLGAYEASWAGDVLFSDRFESIAP